MGYIQCSQVSDLGDLCLEGVGFGRLVLTVASQLVYGGTDSESLTVQIQNN